MASKISMICNFNRATTILNSKLYEKEDNKISTLVSICLVNVMFYFFLRFLPGKSSSQFLETKTEQNVKVALWFIGKTQLHIMLKVFPNML